MSKKMIKVKSMKILKGIAYRRAQLRRLNIYDEKIVRDKAYNKDIRKKTENNIKERKALIKLYDEFY